MGMKTIWIGTLALAAINTPALAMGRGSNVCEPFMAEYCGGLLQQGHDKLVACLREHWEQLSPDCQAVMTPRDEHS